MDFSEARDLFGIIFQILRSDCKFLDCGLITKKHRGLLCKIPRNIDLMNYFRKEFAVDRIHGAVDHRNPGPRWTGRGRRHRARWSFGLRPLRCPRVLAKGRERGSAVGGSPGRERRCGGRASWWRGGGRKNSVVSRSGAGEEKGGAR
jgi:hypothetical protein